MWFRNLLGWILGILFIGFVVFILLPTWISDIKDNIKENKRNAKIAREVEKENKKLKRDKLSKEEKDKITKTHKEGRKRLIIVFGCIAVIFLLPLIITYSEKKQCPNYEDNLLTHIKNIYPTFEPTWYGVHYSHSTCVGYAHGLTERGYTKQEHLYIVRDMMGGKDIYTCWDKNKNCSDFDFLNVLKKYNIK